MLKRVLFQIHWFLGITAGLVLAVIGVTGAMMSFEQEIMEAISPGVAEVAVRAEAPLTPDALVASFLEGQPGRRVQQVTLSAEPGRSARLRLEGLRGGRGEDVYVDPYTGAALGTLRGREFFQDVRSLHRWLLIPRDEGSNIGRQITGASTIALIYFGLSGLYLRWPRRPLDWRQWFRIDLRLRGRSFYWALHSVIGTWVLLVYLLLALTGLSWSYSWYKNGLTVVLTGEQPAPRGERRPQGGPGEAPAEMPSLDAAWAGFGREVGAGYRSVAITVPRRAGQPVEISYVPDYARTNRQTGRISFDAMTGDLVRHEPLRRDIPLGREMNSGLYELHTGEWFGVPGRIINGVAALLMPLFTITGFLLYIDRRRKKRLTRMAAAEAASQTGAPVTGGILVLYASQSGTAEQLAWRTASALTAGGQGASVRALSDATPAEMAAAGRVLFIIATFGDGEPPDHAAAFARQALAGAHDLTGLRYGMLALGDRQYPQFCGFARQVEHWLLGNGAHPFFDSVEVDAGDPAALRHWQQEIAALGAAPAAADWTPPAYEDWQLVERELLNPGSIGAPLYRVRLRPVTGASAWQAGDILEIGPRHDPAVIESLLLEIGRDGDAMFNGMSLRESFGRSLLPPVAELRTADLEAVVAGLRPLPHREYSIASLPMDGGLDLVVRQMNGPDGRLGLGSGWLTQFAIVEGQVAARVRANPAFHGPEGDRPLILVGAGSGIAGLRSHLRARVAAGYGRNWLLFGERQQRHDRLFGAELDQLRQTGGLERLDLVFSRDGGGYVQDQLLAQADDVRAWVAQGAAIYVCGSLEGMGAGVEQALSAVLGDGPLQALREEGRYRRDVY